MKRFKLISLLIVVSVSLFTGHHAKALEDEKTARWMLSACSAAIKMADHTKLSAEDSAMGLVCLGYLQGFVDALPLLSSDTYKNIVCIPQEGISNEQVARIFVKWLRNNPEGLHNKARTELFISLGKSFPCK